jgi:hypothetical protein
MTPKHSRIVTVSFACATLVAATLSGCAASTNPSSAHQHPSGGTSQQASLPTSKASATPTPAGPAPLAANALFQITATATQPSGAKVDLVQTVFAPSAPTASDTTLLNAQCDISGSPSWQSQFNGTLVYLTTTITATPRAGTAAWVNHDYDIGFGLGYGDSAYSGAFRGVEAPCAAGEITAPGTVHGVAVLVVGVPDTDVNGWGYNQAEYGFVGTGNNPNDPDFGGGTTVVDNCAVRVSPAALAAVPALAGWATQPFVANDGCIYSP